MIQLLSSATKSSILMTTLMMKTSPSMLSQEESSEASIGILSKKKTKTRTEVCLQVSSMKSTESDVQMKSSENRFQSVNHVILPVRKCFK